MKISRTSGDQLLFITVFLHISLFSLGYSMMGFSIPLYAFYRGSGQFALGAIGFVWMTPNIAIPLLLSRTNNTRKIQHILIFTILSIVPVAIFTPFISSIDEILGIVVIFGTLQAFWWTAIEMYLGTISKGNQKTITFFSFVWGMSFLIAPALSGFIIDYYGYHAVYSIIAVMFLSSFVLFLLQKKQGLETVKEEGNKSVEVDSNLSVNKMNYLIFVPSFSAGIIIATITSVFPGYLRTSGLTAIAIGTLFSAYASSRIFGFFFLTMMSKRVKIKLFFVVGLLLQLFIVVPFFTVSYIPMIIMMAIVGLGSGYAFSTPLIYIVSNKVRNLAKHVAVYEISLGVSSAATAIFSGFLGQSISINFPYIASFGLIAVFLLIIVSNYTKL